MSENTQNQKVVVVANLKSPVVGFVLALFLGWLGVDRFYKGGFLSILLGIIKLICGVTIVLGWLFVAVVLALANEDLQKTISIAIWVYVLWYILDLIFVPLGIVFDNRKKLAMTQGGSQAQEKINTKSVGKSVLNIAIGVAVVIGVLILAGVIYAFLLS